jgi:hypothetical protein
MRTKIFSGGMFSMKRYPVFAFVVVFFLAAGEASANSAFPFSSLDYHSELFFDSLSGETRLPGEFGIKEVVPKEYLSRYQKWKDELLATEYGRKLWDSYAENREFLLTIKVAGSRKFGAGTDDFEWSDDGKLVAATVTLGKDLDKGFPDPVYYPVMNSLSMQGELHRAAHSVLASTKMAHEIGHVGFTAHINSSLFRKQNKLMESYYKIFLGNGFNTRDPRLVALENELGGQPIAIWEDREYWSEVSAMRYLVEKLGNESFYCSVINKIRQNVSEYARNYKDRFELNNLGAKPSCGN